jgi:hypothetical protein
MKRIAFLTIAVVTVACFVVSFSPASGHAAGEAAPIYVTQIPTGYRDWKVISVAHEEGNLNSLGAILGNDTAIKAYRDGKLPYPDGTIMAALHCRHVPSEENNKVFGRAQSFVPGTPTNIQFMVKDSTKYAQRADGDLVTSTQATASPAMRRSLKPASPATRRPKLAILSSPITHLDAGN